MPLGEIEKPGRVLRFLTARSSLPLSVALLVVAPLGPARAARVGGGALPLMGCSGVMWLRHEVVITALWVGSGLHFATRRRRVGLQNAGVGCDGRVPRDGGRWGAN